MEFTMSEDWEMPGYYDKITFFGGENAYTPTRKHPRDAGIDLYVTTGATLLPGEVKIFNTDLSVRIPHGYFGWITNKSRSDYVIGGGIIDEEYQGDLLVKVINNTNKSISIVPGVAVAQLILIRTIHPEIVILRKEDEFRTGTARGTSGGIVTQLSFEEIV